MHPDLLEQLFGTNNNNVNDQNFKLNFQYKEKFKKRNNKKGELACSNKNSEVYLP